MTILLAAVLTIAVFLPVPSGLAPSSLDGPAPLAPDAAFGVKGTATWYALKGPGFYAAMNQWRWGDEPFMAHVCRTDTGRCVDVIVNDHLPCCTDRKYGPTVIDLSADTFLALGAPLSVGVLPVRVTVGVDSGGVGPRPTPPSTNTAP